MSRLSEEFHSSLTPSVLQILFKKSIYTCLGFVRTNPELLAKITGLQYKQILEIKDAILTKFSSQLRFGHKLYTEILNHCALIPTGIENLDKLLDSGFMTGNIYELCGFSASGKTQICMTISANIITTSNQQVFYIDTKNDISAQRLSDIIATHQSSSVGESLQKIQICQVRTACDLLQELHQLKLQLNSSKEKYLGFRLIIIDSLPTLFQRYSDQCEKLSMLNNIASLLKYITVEFHLVILLTNYVRSWTVEEIEGTDDDDQVVLQQINQPALGKYWAHVPNVRVMVKKLDVSNECLLTLLKSSSLPVGKSVKVKLGDNGVT